MKDSHCSSCGARYASVAKYPRICLECTNMVWDNPIPVGVIVVPIRDSIDDDGGVLLIRRGENPCKGELALPGGHLEMGETWQEGSARELMEEVGLVVEPEDLKIIAVESSEKNILIFSATKPMTTKDLAEFVPNSEVTELVVVKEPIPLAWSTHQKVLREFLEGSHLSINWERTAIRRAKIAEDWKKRAEDLEAQLADHVHGEID